MPASSGSPTQIVSTCSTAADLAGLPDDQFKSGDLAYVAELYPNATFRLNRDVNNGQVADGVNFIATRSGNGLWELYPPVVSTVQRDWYIDAVSGDDTNNGASALTALRTWAEFARRVSIIDDDTNVFLLTDLDPTDPIVGTFTSRGGLHALSIVGTPNVLDSGVIAGRADPAANAEGTLTSVAIPAWTVGAIVEVTDGVTEGQATVVMADVAGTAQVPFWSDNTTHTLPAVGRAIRMFDGSTAPYCQISGNGVNVNVRYVRFDDAAGISFLAAGGQGVFRECQFAGIVENTGSCQYTACAFLAGCDFNGGNPNTLIFGGGIFQALTFDKECFLRIDGAISYAAISVGGGDRGGAALALDGNGLGVFNSASFGILVGAGSKLYVDNSAQVLYGDGNTTFGLLVQDGGRAQITTITPTITGAGQAIALDGQATCVPPLTAADAAVPAAAALATWANWTGAPFSRVAVNYAFTGAGPAGAASGSAIVGT